MSRSVRTVFILVGIVILGGLIVIGLRAAGVQVTIPLTQAEMADEPHKVMKIGIVSIDGKVANPQEGVILDTLQEDKELNVEISGNIAQERKQSDDAQQTPQPRASSSDGEGEESVWVIVESPDAQKYQVFGPAKGNQDSWVVPNVKLPYQGTDKANPYFLRAAVSPRRLSLSSGVRVDTLEGFTMVSWPAVPVIVLKWIPGADRLTITTIGGKSVEQRAKLEADVSADISGTQPQASSEKVYLILHPANSEIWRVVGPVKVEEGTEAEKGKRWHCRGVSFVEPGQPHWRYVDVFAIQSADALKPGPIPYNT